MSIAFNSSSGGSNVTVTLPAGSTGRRVSLYGMDEVEAYFATAGDTSAVISSFTPASPPSYYFRITDTDGSTLVYRSDVEVVQAGDAWTWDGSATPTNSVTKAVAAANEDILGQVGHMDFFIGDGGNAYHNVSADNITTIKSRVLEVAPSLGRVFIPLELIRGKGTEFLDDFNRGDGDIGANYTKQGTWNISTNEIVKASATDGDYAYYNGQTYGDVFLNAKYKRASGGTGNPEFILRRSADGSEYYSVIANYTAQRLDLTRNGSVIDTASVTLSADTYYRIEARLIGSEPKWIERNDESGSGSGIEISLCRIRGVAGAGTIARDYELDYAPASAEYDIEIDVHVVSADNSEVGVLGRLAAVGTSTWYLARYVKNTGASEAHWQIWKRIHPATWTKLGEYSQALTIGQTYHMKFEIRDAAKKLYVDDVERVSTSDNVITAAGKTGLRIVTYASITDGLHGDNYELKNTSGTVLASHDFNDVDDVLLEDHEGVSIDVEHNKANAIMYRDTAANAVVVDGYVGMQVNGAGNANPIYFDDFNVWIPEFDATLSKTGWESFSEDAGHGTATVYADLYHSWISWLKDNSVNVLLTTVAWGEAGFIDLTRTKWDMQLFVDFIDWLVTTKGNTNITVLTPSNEPELIGTRTWLTPESMGAVTVALRDALDAKGLTGIEIYSLDFSEGQTTKTSDAQFPSWLDDQNIKDNTDMYSIHIYRGYGIGNGKPMGLLYGARRILNIWDDDATRPPIGIFEIGILENALGSEAQWMVPSTSLFFAKQAVRMIEDGMKAVGSYYIGAEGAWEAAALHYMRWGSLMYNDADTFYGGAYSAWDRKPYHQVMRVLSGVLKNGMDAHSLSPSAGSNIISDPHYGLWLSSATEDYMLTAQDDFALTYYPLADVTDSGLIGLDLTNSSVTFSGGYAIFDNAADYLQVLPDEDVIAQFWPRKTFSMGMRFRASAQPAAWAILFKLYKLTTAFTIMGFVVHSDGRPYFSCRDSGSTERNSYAAGIPTNLWDGAWHQIVAAYDGAVLRQYVDGSQVSSNTIAFSLYEFPADDTFDNHYLNIGGAVMDIDDAWIGHHITANQVAQLYNSGTFRDFQWLRDNAYGRYVIFSGFDADAVLGKRLWEYDDGFSFSEDNVTADGSGNAEIIVPYKSVLSLGTEISGASIPIVMKHLREQRIS